MPQLFDTPLYSSDQSIDRVLNAGLPVLLVFLDGAAPAALEQEMKRVAKENAGRLLVVQMNPKDSPAAARNYHVSGAPALVTVKDRQVYSQAEPISGDDLAHHASYLLGKGPKPESKTRPQPQPAASSYVRGGSGGSQAAPGNGAGGTASGGVPVTLTDATFDREVLRSPLPVVVDFWAPWCGPCRMVAPTLDKLAREWNGRVKIAKVNVDENPRVAGQYGVSSIPTMMVVKNGQVLDRWAGALPEPAMRSRLAPLVK